jgi:kynurenine formamidase
VTRARGQREWGAELRNWGRWGAEDQLGTLNFLTPERRAAAARLVVSGQVVPLGLEFGAAGPQLADGERRNPLHVMTRTGSAEPAPGGFLYTDDLVVMHTQCATQIDALAHVGYDGQLYNGHPLSSVSSRGAQHLGIEAMRAGIHGRGVLADLPRYWGVDRLQPGQPITAADLTACLAAQGTTVGGGDVLLVRTGWVQVFLVDGDRERYLATEPGLTLDVTAWLHEREVAFLASDNWGVEVVDAGEPAEHMPVHCVLIRDMGMPLGEMFDLEELAVRCRAEGRWDFWFSCLPLPIVAGVGSPLAPVAVF